MTSWRVTSAGTVGLAGWEDIVTELQCLRAECSALFRWKDEKFCSDLDMGGAEGFAVLLWALNVRRFVRV